MASGGWGLFVGGPGGTGCRMESFSLVEKIVLGGSTWLNYCIACELYIPVAGRSVHCVNVGFQMI